MDTNDRPKSILDDRMKQALSEMVEVDTPVLDALSYIFGLPLSTLGRYPALCTIWSATALEILGMGAIKDAAIILGFPFVSIVISAIFQVCADEIDDRLVSDELLGQLKKEGLIIHSYKREGLIPDFLVDRTSGQPIPAQNHRMSNSVLHILMGIASRSSSYIA